MGGCHTAPVGAIGHALHEHATADSVADAVAHQHTHPDIPPFVGLDEYRAGGGYTLLEACLSGTRTRDSVLEAMEKSEIRGMGGAGFPAGRQWGFALAPPWPARPAVNCDYGDPCPLSSR